MPITKTQGLRGLPGLNSVSEEERNAFMLANDDQLKQFKSPKVRDQAADILYNNQLFVKKFGQEAFDSLNDGTEESYNRRNQVLRSTVINEAFNNKFGKDKDYNYLRSELDEQGMLDLLQSDYIGTQEREKRFSDDMKEAEDSKTLLGKTFSAWSAQRSARNSSEKDIEIRNSIFNQVQDRREKESEEDAAKYYTNILDADLTGQKSLSDSYDEFDALATKNSPHYATFKNSDWLKDYSHEDRLKDYAKYQALKDRYGESVAMQYLDRTVQDKVADAQDDTWTGNTLKGVLTTIWSDLGSNVALLSHLGDLDRLAIWNQGKDPNKPVYDKSGNVVDYEKNENWATNPAYWNDVYKYNTFTPTEIKAIEERGGISEDVNVRNYGYTPDFFSWDTLQEGFKQGGHVVAGVIETGLTGGLVGKTVGLGAKAAMKAAGLSTKAIETATKAGNITNDLFVMATTGLEGAQLEAMGTFEEQMQSAREKIQQQIRRELQDYQQNIDYDDPTIQQSINSVYQQLKQEDRRRVATANDDPERRGTEFPLSDEFLMNQARMKVTNDLVTAKGEELEELHKKDEIAAADAASKAYGANFIMDYVKNIPITVGIQKFKIAKGSMRGAFDNTIAKNIVADAETGGVKRAVSGARKDIRIGTKKHGFTIPGKEGSVSKYASLGNLAKETVKQLGGGFADEYLDGINASFASGIGNNEFDNYINRTYNPQAYQEVTDTFLGNMLSGLSEGVEGITDRQNLYEGFIGMTAPFASVMVNPNAIFNPRDTWRAIVDGTDARGREVGIAERLSNVFINPLVDSYVRLEEQDRDIDDVINTINTVVASKKDNLQDAASVVSAMGEYDSKVLRGEDSLLDTKDAKLHNAFTLIDALSTLEGVQGGTSSQLYQDAMGTIEGLADGTLSQETMDNEIDKFLADPNNKSILEDPNKRQIAAERLQKNAQYFMDMKKKMDEVNEAFSKSPSLIGINPKVLNMMRYNIVASDDYKKRLEELEDELQIGKTDTESIDMPNMYLRYATASSRNTAINAREKILSQNNSKIEEVKTKIEEAKNTAKQLSDKLKNTADNNEAELIRQDLLRQTELVDSRNFYIASLEGSNQIVQSEIDTLKKIQEDTSDAVFSVEDIFNADARDRAFMLNDANRSNYTKDQLAVIDHAKKLLTERDPEALGKIQDAGTLAARISDVRDMQDKIRNNDRLAATYIQAVERLRDRAAMSEVVEKAAQWHYNNIEKAYANRESDALGLKRAVLQTTSDLIESYINDHPEQREAISPYLDILDLFEKGASVINELDITNTAKRDMRSTLLRIGENTNSREDYMKAIDSILDADAVPDNVKKSYEDLLQGLERFGYQRDNTVVENRKQRKEREAAAKRQREEEAKRLEAERKAAAEKAVQDVERKRIEEEEKRKQEQNSNQIDSTQSNPDLMEDAEDISGFWETDDSTSETDNDVESSINASVEPSVVTDQNGNTAVVSPTIEEQKAQINAGENSSIVSVESLEDIDESNEEKEKIISTKDNTFVANPMNPWYVYPDDKKDLSEDDTLSIGGKLNHKVGDNKSGMRLPDGTLIDSMNRYYRWVEQTMKINLQEIIDTELSQILKSNPALKIKFMTVNTEMDNKDDIMDDKAMHPHLLLVIDYDDGINKNITKIHSDKNGGVLESQGKKYLVVGVVGYGDKNNPVNKHRQELYDTLYTNLSAIKDKAVLRKEGTDFFKKNPNERFYVSPNFETEIVEDSLIPGWIVNQLETDEATEFRSISELLFNDEGDFNEQRNPSHLTWKDLSWGIQKGDIFLPIKGKKGIGRGIMKPQNPIKNLGNVFILIPASNGKVMPSYIQPLKYTEMRDGKLKNEVTDILRRITANRTPGPQTYNERLNAIKDLARIFHFSLEGDNLLLSEDGNTISFVKGGDGRNAILENGTLNLSDERAREKFQRLFEALNPRVSITADVLMSTDRLKIYDEAGALTTDIALMHTVGSGYAVWAVDGDGKMLKPEYIDNPTWKTSNDRNANVKDVYYNGKRYKYNRTSETFVDEKGNRIVDEDLITELKINRQIADGEIIPEVIRGEYEYYLLEKGTNPKVVKVNTSTKKVTTTTEAETKMVVESNNKKINTANKEARKDAATAAIASTNDEMNGAVDIDMSRAEGYSEQNGMPISSLDEAPTIWEKEEPGEEVPAKKEKEEEGRSAPEKNVSVERVPYEATSPTQTFVKMLQNRKLGKENTELGLPNNGILGLISELYSDSPIKYNNEGKITKSASKADVAEFLKQKGIETEAIGTSDEDIKAWVQHLKCSLR